MFKGGEDLLINIFFDKELINNNLNVVFEVRVEFNFFADVVFNSVDSDVSAAFRTDVVKEVIIILAVDFKDGCVDFYLGILWQCKQPFQDLVV